MFDDTFAQVVLTFDFPPPLAATQRATVLRPLSPGPPVWRDQFHATVRQFLVQPVRLVGVVADETHRQLIDKPLCEWACQIALVRAVPERGLSRMLCSTPSRTHCKKPPEAGLDG